MYSINWLKLVNRDVPFAYRTIKMVQWLLALINPVLTNHSLFVLFRAQKLEEIKVTGQVGKLEYWLNRKFDPSLKQIHIEDSQSADPLFIFLEVENKPVYLPQFLSGQVSDFTVFIPFEIRDQEYLIKSFLDTYKLPTKNYVIVYI